MHLQGWIDIEGQAGYAFVTNAHALGSTYIQLVSPSSWLCFQADSQFSTDENIHTIFKMKLALTYLPFFALILGVNAMKQGISLPIVDVVDGQFVSGNADDLDAGGLEKRACTNCYPYLCDGRCCHYNKCCKNSCCQAASTGCNRKGHCVIQC